jgi:hypothetical protein
MSGFVILASASAAVYLWASTRLAPYTFPWSAPWRVGTNRGWSAAALSATRLFVLVGAAVLVAWPYVQYGVAQPIVHPTVTPVISSASAAGGIPNLTWIWIAFASAAMLGVLAMIPRLRILNRHRAPAPRILRPVRPQDESIQVGKEESPEEWLFDPDPRRAIFASYARFENIMAARGAPRRPHETAFEYLRRLLDRGDSPGEPARALTALFQRVAFSGSRPDESMRATAVQLITALSPGEA